MQSFTDAQGRKWRLSLTLGAVERAKAELGIDLLNPLDAEEGQPSAVTKIHADPRTLVGLAWILVEDQAGKVSVSPEGFASGLDGEAFKRLTAAVLTEVDLFFRCLGRDDHAEAALRNREILSRVVAGLAEAFKAGESGGATSGGSPEHAGSTPAR